MASAGGFRAKTGRYYTAGDVAKLSGPMTQAEAWRLKDEGLRTAVIDGHVDKVWQGIDAKLKRTKAEVERLYSSRVPGVISDQRGVPRSKWEANERARAENYRAARELVARLSALNNEARRYANLPAPRSA